MKAKFIVFEGVDGSGKSTQVQLLSEEFQRRKIPCTIFREPGTSDLGETIRNLVLNSTIPINNEAKTLLFMAARAQMMDEVIKFLDEGFNVVMDRWSYSTYAYQDIGLSSWTTLTGYACGNMWPTHGFWLDIPEELRIKRLEGKAKDNFEKLGSEFYENVARKYGIMSSAHPVLQRVNATLSPEEIHKIVLTNVFGE